MDYVEQKKAHRAAAADVSGEDPDEEQATIRSGGIQRLNHEIPAIGFPL